MAATQTHPRVWKHDVVSVLVNPLKLQHAWTSLPHCTCNSLQASLEPAAAWVQSSAGADESQHHEDRIRAEKVWGGCPGGGPFAVRGYVA